MIQRPILLDIPDAFESERLLLRAPRPGDGEALNAAVIESLEELRPWMPWAMQAPTLAESEEYVRRSAARYAAREDLPLLLWCKASGALVGGSGMHRIDWEVPSVEIGYWVRTSHAGKGYITEAVHAITAFAFDVIGAHRVEIHCDERNVRSAAVARRAGFELEGILRNEARSHASLELRNTMVFAKVSHPRVASHHPAIQEVIELHAFFEAWLGGALPNEEHAFARFTTATAPDFTLIGPEGNAMDAAAVAGWIRQSHGTRPGFRLWTSDHRLLHADGACALVTYLEWQTRDDATTCRISTALFLAAPGAPNGYIWRHVHETWCTPR